MKERRNQKRPRRPTTDAQGLAARCEEFLEWMRLKNYSERTVENRAVYLGYFFDWCEERSITRPQEVTKPILERYQRWMFHYRKENGQPMSFRTQYARLTPIRAFFRWLARQNYILYNPASELEMPRSEKRLPKHVLTASEAETVIAQPDVSTSAGVRDRAMLETFYSTGIRRMELIHLRLFDTDVERGTLMVRQGKGKKDRMIPIGERALGWIDKYLTEARPGLVVGTDEGTLFLSSIGEPFTPGRLTALVREYVDAASLNKRGSCHLFRHTMATLMLENGADIRFIQQMLGHAELSTTQIYTQVSIRKLKEIHTLTHPADRRANAGTNAARAELTAAADSVEGASDAAWNLAAEEKAGESTAGGAEFNPREELLLSLAAESAEEEAESTH